MSTFVTSDPHAAGGPRLYWLTDGLGLASDRPLDLDEVFAAGKWRGVDAQAERLLLWDDIELHLVEGGAHRRVFEAHPRGFERAFFVDDGAEIYWRETKGMHPTDCQGFRMHLDLESGATEQLAIAHIGPPPASTEGRVYRSATCSSARGRVEWGERDGKLWWRGVDAPRRRKLPDIFEKLRRHRVLADGQETWIAGFEGKEVALVKPGSRRPPLRGRIRERGSYVHDVTLHAGELWVALSHHDPRKVRLA